MMTFCLSLSKYLFCSHHCIWAHRGLICISCYTLPKISIKPFMTSIESNRDIICVSRGPANYQTTVVRVQRSLNRYNILVCSLPLQSICLFSNLHDKHFTTYLNLDNFNTSPILKRSPILGFFPPKCPLSVATSCNMGGMVL